MPAKKFFPSLAIIILFFGITIKTDAAPETAPDVTLSVNTLADTQTDSDGKCSLREAIINANNADQSGSTNCGIGGLGADTINITLSGVISLGSSLPWVTSDITINGNEAGTTIDGAQSYQIFYHQGTGTTLVLKGLTIKYGDAGTSFGGGAHNESGNLEVHGCTFHRNSALNGGAVNNNGGNTLVKNSTFIDNRATHLTLDGSGGAISNSTGWSVNIVNSTFNENTAKTSGSTLFNSSGAINVYNSIIAWGENVDNCAGDIYNEGNNIDTGTSCGFGTDKGSMSLKDPLFAVTGFHGGPTVTISLQSNSAAIDGVTYSSPNQSDDWDQRGYPRPVDGDRNGVARHDIGAFEAQLDIFLPAVFK